MSILGEFCIHGSKPLYIQRVSSHLYSVLASSRSCTCQPVFSKPVLSFYGFFDAPSSCWAHISPIDYCPAAPIIASLWGFAPWLFVGQCLIGFHNGTFPHLLDTTMIIGSWILLWNYLEIYEHPYLFDILLLYMLLHGMCSCENDISGPQIPSLTARAALSH